MKQWKRIISVSAVIAGLGLMAPVTSHAAKDLVLTGDAKCTACHDESGSPELLSIGKRRHGVTADKRTPTCTSCHGASEKHLAGNGKPDRTYGKHSKTTAEDINENCLSCHQGGSRINWPGGPHQSNDVTCASCHKIHSAKDEVKDKLNQTEVCFGCHKEQRVESFKFSHHPIREGKVVCSSCHNPHGSTGPKQLIKNTLNETCYTCHAEKRGPFLWEHPPAADNCANCHLPHGSNNPALLKNRQPYLCEQCHDYTNHPGNVYSGRGLPASQGGAAANAAGNSGAQQMLLRACANCHTQVHGSNHPSGPRQTR